MTHIPVKNLAPFNSLKGQEQRSALLVAGWFCCAWSQAYWPPDAHSARPDQTAVQTMCTRLALGEDCAKN